MTLDEYKRIVQGKTNKQNGEHFENLVIAACEYYKTQGIAYIDKNSEPMRPIRRLDDGRYIAVFVKKAQPDFSGILRGGQAIMFECKHTDADRIKQNVVQPHQAERLDAQQEMGAICFILVSLGGCYYRVPWDTWKAIQSLFGRKYATYSDLEPFKVRVVDGVINFLERGER